MKKKKSEKNLSKNEKKNLKIVIFTADKIHIIISQRRMNERTNEQFLYEKQNTITSKYHHFER